LDAGEPRTRRDLRDAIRSAMKAAMDGGMSARHALADDMALAAMLFVAATGNVNAVEAE
jgi:hypothetical protein